jgi:hypothetical protein
VIVVFAVRGHGYAGFGEVGGGEVVHCVCRLGVVWMVVRSGVGRGVWKRGTLVLGSCQRVESGRRRGEVVARPRLGWRWM